MDRLNAQHRTADNLLRMDRYRLGRMHNPLRGLLHGTAAAAAVVGAVVLAARASERRHLMAGLVFGSVAIGDVHDLVPLPLRGLAGSAQGLHAAPRPLDDLPGGSGDVHPVRGGGPRWMASGGTARLVWSVAIVGIALKFALPRVKTGLSVGIQHSMGWLSLAAMPLIWQRVGPGAVLLVFAGGVCYTVGTVIFATKRPRLFPQVSSRITSCSMCWWWRAAPSISWRCCGTSCPMGPERARRP